MSRRWGRPGVLHSLGVLNAVLFLFWLWVKFAVPVRESGLAWVLYFPLAGGTLALIGLLALFRRRLRAKSGAEV